MISDGQNFITTHWRWRRSLASRWSSPGYRLSLLGDGLADVLAAMTAR